MYFYEILFIIRQDLPTQDVYKLAEYYKELIISLNSFIIKNEYWGLRSLAYEIKKNKRGHYMFFIIKSNKSVINKIKKSFKSREDILKSFFIKINEIENTPSHMMQTKTDNES